MTTRFEAALRAQLLQASDRSHQLARRRRRVTQLGAAVLVVSVGAFAVSLSRATPAAAGVDIQRVGDRLEIRLTELEQEPGVVQRALREAGLDVTVAAVPTGPSRVGHFVGEIGSALPAGVAPLPGENPAAFRGFSVPVGWPGHLELRLGRVAEAGEHYATAVDAFAAGEPLACSDVLGASVADAAGALEASGLDVKVAPSDAPERGLSLADAVASRPTWRIVRGSSISSTSVNLVITPEGTPVPGHDTTPRATC